MLNKFKCIASRQQTANRNKRTYQVELLEDRELLTADFTWIVTNSNSSGTGSLRQAICDANSSAGSDYIEFALSSVAPITLTSVLPAIVDDDVTIDGTSQAGYAGVPIIELDGSGIGSGVNDGIVVNASNCVIMGLSIINFSGAGISIESNSESLIENTSIFQNYIGVSSAGDAEGNGVGINIGDGASHVNVGVTINLGDPLFSEDNGNVISGNSGDGIYVSGSSTSNVLIAGNRIGVNPDGDESMANGNFGVQVTGGASLVQIGIMSVQVVGIPEEGTILLPADESQRNIISGNTKSGISISGSSTHDVYVSGNYIGLDATGCDAIGNGEDGVSVSDGAYNIGIGQALFPNTYLDESIYLESVPDSALGNVISGNSGFGIKVYEVIGGTTETPAVRIAGNLIGLTASGSLLTYTIASDAHQGNQDGGILLDESSGVLIGIGLDILRNAEENDRESLAELSRNIVSGNDSKGITISGRPSITDYVVLDPAKDRAELLQNVVTGNYIGTNISGQSDIGNLGDGIFISNGAIANFIGPYEFAHANPTDPGTFQEDWDIQRLQGNLISGNIGNGVYIHGKGSYSVNENDIANTATGTMFNFVTGNYIGTDASGTEAIANSANGVLIDNAAAYNQIGNTGASAKNAAGFRNVISGNGAFGVAITNSWDPSINTEEELYPYTQTTSGRHANSTDTNQIAGNIIGMNSSITAAIGNGDGGGLIENHSLYNYFGTDPYTGPYDDTDHLTKNIIAGNDGPGILIKNASSSPYEDGYEVPDNTRLLTEVPDMNGIYGNWIGITPDNHLFANSGDGIRIEDSRYVRIGSVAAADTQNIISGNGGNGISIHNSSDIAVMFALVGLSPEGGSFASDDVTSTGNVGNGILIDGPSKNVTIGNEIFSLGLLFSSLATRVNGFISNLNSELISNSLTPVTFDPLDHTEFENSVDREAVLDELESIDLTVYFDTVVYGTANEANEYLQQFIVALRNYEATARAYTNGTVVSANGEYGIEIDGSGLESGSIEGIRIVGSTIGLNADGDEDAGNTLAGIYIHGAVTDAIIGDLPLGVSPYDGEMFPDGALARGNTISGNGTNGVLLENLDEGIIAVSASRIGTSRDGTLAIGNGTSGVEVNGGSALIVIGSGYADSDTDLGNVIAFNNEEGVLISGYSWDTIAETAAIVASNIISSNGLATDNDNEDGICISDSAGVIIGGDGFGNDVNTNDGNGIAVESESESVFIYGNEIHENLLAGVLVDEALSTSISHNSIFENVGLGILLSSGGNNGQAKPTAGTLSYSSPNLTVPVTVSGATGPLTIEFYVADSDGEEGETYLISFTYTGMGSSQNFDLDVAALGLTSSDRLVMTATDSDGNTSIFSVGLNLSGVI